MYMFGSYSKFYFHCIYCIILVLIYQILYATSFLHRHIALSLPAYCCLYQNFSSTSLLFYLEGEGSGFFWNNGHTATPTVQSPKKQDNYHPGTVVTALHQQCTTGGPKNNRNLNVACELEVVARCATRCCESTQYSSSLPHGVNL